ncbi:hypothetical protein PHIN5_13910 [Polynucleobacter sp. HIN5]|nr:hypothetical protein PHIN5_13910 [Polynucleobacter sp. HIN5]
MAKVPEFTATVPVMAFEVFERVKTPAALPAKVRVPLTVQAAVCVTAELVVFALLIVSAAAVTLGRASVAVPV